MIDNNLILLGVFAVVGIFTFSFRAVFLFYMPQKLKRSDIFKNGLESVPSSLLVALVIPFTFFTSGSFLPYRIQVLAVVLTIPVVYYIKKPGLSLPVAIVILGFLTILKPYLIPVLGF